MIIGPAFLYGVKYWPIKKIQAKGDGYEMIMIHWMFNHTRLDRIINEVIRNKVGVAPIEDKMREVRL